MNGRTITCAMCGRQRSDDKYWIHDGRDFCTKKCTYAWDRKKEAENTVSNGRELVVSRCLPPGDGRCLCCGFTGRAKDRACVKHGEEFCRRCAGECGAQKRARERQQGETGLKQEILDPGELSQVEIEDAEYEKYTAALRKTTDGHFEAGDALIRAKERLEHGRWRPWLERVGLSRNRANVKMRIASDPNLLRYRKANVPHAGHLPTSLRALEALTGLETEDFDALVGADVIRAELTGAEVNVALADLRHEEPGRRAAGAVPEGKFGAILADPPWKFETMGSGGLGRSADNHYPTMPTSDIMSLLMDDQFVWELAADDAVLFLWAMPSMVQDALAVMSNWGFKFKTFAFVWVKDGAPGLGYWTRKRTEICLLGTRGNPKRLNADVDEAIYAPRFEHSVKPKAVYERIERLVNGPYIELFARHNRDGWTSWGNHPGLAK